MYQKPNIGRTVHKIIQWIARYLYAREASSLYQPTIPHAIGNTHMVSCDWGNAHWHDLMFITPSAIANHDSHPTWHRYNVKSYIPSGNAIRFVFNKMNRIFLVQYEVWGENKPCLPLIERWNWWWQQHLRYIFSSDRIFKSKTSNVEVSIEQDEQELRIDRPNEDGCKFQEIKND